MDHTLLKAIGLPAAAVTLATGALEGYAWVSRRVTKTKRLAYEVVSCSPVVPDQEVSEDGASSARRIEVDGKEFTHLMILRIFNAGTKVLEPRDFVTDGMELALSGVTDAWGSAVNSFPAAVMGRVRVHQAPAPLQNQRVETDYVVTEGPIGRDEVRTHLRVTQFRLFPGNSLTIGIVTDGFPTRLAILEDGPVEVREAAPVRRPSSLRAMFLCGLGWACGRAAATGASWEFASPYVKRFEWLPDALTAGLIVVCVTVSARVISPNGLVRQTVRALGDRWRKWVQAGS